MLKLQLQDKFQESLSDMETLYTGKTIVECVEWVEKNKPTYTFKPNNSIFGGYWANPEGECIYLY